MKALLSALCAVVLIVSLSFQATSDEPKDVDPVVESNPFGDLLSTLKEAYRLRLGEYKGGGSASVDVIRVNKELYDAERRVLIAGRKTEPQEKFTARAREIEAIAEEQLANGAGSRADFLDARAGRLQAELALYNATKSN
jgi:hypothetical protein